MDSITLIVTALALGMDAFAISAAIAATLPIMTMRRVFRLTWHFGLFQGLMTVVGWLGGAGLSAFSQGLNHWIAFGILVFLGLKMIHEARSPMEKAQDFDPTKGWSLVILSVATSIDALAVGVSLSLLEAPVIRPATMIGLVALVMAYLGTRLGRRAASSLGSYAEIVGGLVLILIGVRILVNHLWLNQGG